MRLIGFVLFICGQYSQAGSSSHDEDVSNLLQWIRSVGSSEASHPTPTPGARLTEIYHSQEKFCGWKTDSFGGRSLVDIRSDAEKKRASPHSLILAVPIATTMSRESALRRWSDPTLAGALTNCSISNASALALHLMCERSKRGASFFAPFINSLPWERASDQTALNWEVELTDLSPALGGLLREMRALRQRAMDEASSIVKNVDCLDQPNWKKTFRRAWNLLLSRQASSVPGVESSPLLTPLLDLANHDDLAGQYRPVYLSDPGLPAQAIALPLTAAQESIHHDYDGKERHACAHEMLANFGFVPKQSAQLRDCAMLPFVGLVRRTDLTNVGGIMRTQDSQVGEALRWEVSHDIAQLESVLGNRRKEYGHKNGSKSRRLQLIYTVVEGELRILKDLEGQWRSKKKATLDIEPTTSD